MLEARSRILISDGIMTYSTTSTRTNTRTWAADLTSKVAADLKRCQRYYGKPTDAWIEGYEQELTEFLVAGFIHTIEYGFKKSDQRVVSLLYNVDAAGNLSDDRAGGVYARADTTGASWFSYATYSSAYWALTSTQREDFKKKLPFDRTSGNAPSDGAGYWTVDRSYSQDGSGVRRQTFRPY